MSIHNKAGASGTENSLRARCPSCSQLIGYAQEKVGMQVNCPKCKSPFLLPAAPSSNAASSVAPSTSTTPPRKDLIVSKPVSAQPGNQNPLGLGTTPGWSSQPAQPGYAQNSYAQNGYAPQPYQPMHNSYAAPQAYHPAATVDRFGIPYKSKTAAALLGFFLGMYGAHNFYLGRTGIAVTQLLLTIAGIATSCIIIGIVPLMGVGIWALVETIMILTGGVNDSRGRPLV